MSFKIKGRDDVYYDIFDGGYFAGGSNTFTITDYKMEDNDITLTNIATTSSNTKYVATTQNTFINSNYDIFHNGSSYLIAKYDVITTVGTTIKAIDNRYNRIIVVGISGGGGGEAGTRRSGGGRGGDGGVFAFETSNVPSSISVTVGDRGGGGRGNGGNGGVGGTTKISWNEGKSNKLSYVQVTGGGGGYDTSTGTVSASNYYGVYTINKTNSNWLIETNTSYGNHGSGGGKGRGGSPGQQGAVYIYYFHK